MPMSSERSKSGRESQNHTGIWQTANQLKEFARLRIPVDSKADFHLGDRRRRSRRGADTALDRIFQGLLREANRELASLLRDVRAGSDTTLLDAAESTVIRDLLRRALQCATKQYLVQTELSNLALMDELTGLYNRRGFLAVTEQHLAAIRRNQKIPVILYADLDGLKVINDSLGHQEGDRALVKARAVTAG